MSQYKEEHQWHRKKENVSFAEFKDDPQYYEDFRKQLYDGFHVQKTDLDKLSFIMELAAMERDLTDISSRLSYVPLAIDRDDYESEEEYRQALQNEEERKKRESFSEEEKKELGFSDGEQSKSFPVSSPLRWMTAIPYTSRTEKNPIWSRASWGSCGERRPWMRESITRSCRKAIS